jgi:hypothetical protein
MGLDSIKSSAQAAVQQAKQKVAEAPPSPPPATAPKQSTKARFEESSFEPAKAKAKVSLTVPEKSTPAGTGKSAVTAAAAASAAASAASGGSSVDMLSENKTTGTSGVAPITLQQATDVDNARMALKTAQDRTSALDEELAKQLADFGPALTDTQRAQYVKTFRAEHQPLYDNVAIQAEALDKLMKEHGPALEAAAVKDSTYAQLLYDTHKVLANSPKAEEAAKFASKVLAEPDSPLGQAMKGYTKLEEEVALPAIPNAWTQFLSEEADLDSAFERLNGIVKPYVEGGNASIETKEAFKDLREITRTKTFDPLVELAEAGQKSPMAKAFAVAGLALGAYEGMEAAKDGKYLEATKAFAQAGKDGMDVLKFSTAALKNAGIIGEYGAKSKAVSTFATKLAPGLGLVATVTSLAINGDKVRNGTANAGTGIAIAGDCLCMMGSVMAVIPGGQLPGTFFTGLGGAIGAVGSLVEGKINDADFKAAQRRGLEAAGIEEPLTSILMEGEPERMTELQEELGLNAQQIQQLALRYPSLVTKTKGEGMSLDSFKGLKKDFSLNSQQTYELLLAIGNGTKNPGETLQTFLSTIDDFDGYTPQQWMDGFERRANERTFSRNATDYNTAYLNAFNYLSEPTRRSGGDY